MSSPSPNPRMQAIVIGGSAGAVNALLQILPSLPADYPLPVMVVVHLPPDSDSTLARLLNDRCKIRVKEAEDKEPIRPGVVYLAAPNYHLLVEPDFHLSLSQDDPVLFSRPSIDVLFQSAADAYGDSLAAIILTGGSSDGSEGLREVCKNRGVAVVQDPEKSEMALMPKSALKTCPEAKILDLPQLVALLQSELLLSAR